MKPHFWRLTLLLLFALPLRAETIYQGRVLLPDGKAATGADVALVQYHFSEEDNGGWQAKSLVSSDTSGQWQLKVNDQSEKGDYSVQGGTLVAFKAGFGLVWQRVSRTTKGPVTLKLARPGKRKLTVADTEGKPIGGAVAQITFVAQQTETVSGHYISLPESLQRRWQQKTGAAGTLLLSAVPADSSTAFEISAENHAVLTFNDQRDSSDFQFALPRAVKIKGRLVAEPRVTLSSAGRKLVLSAYDEKSKTSWDSGVLLTDANGEFTFDKAAPGTASVSFLPQDEARDSGFLPQIEAKIDIKADKAEQEIQVPLKALRAVTVTGKVTNEIGEPLAGVTLYGTRLDKPQYDRKLTTTIAGGTYSFPAPVGETKLRVFNVPQGYSTPSDYNPQIIKVSADAAGPFSGPSFVLSKAVSLAARVVNAGGKPQPDALVFLFSRFDFYGGDQLRADAEGRVTLPNLNGKETVTIAAKTATAMSPRVEFNPSQQKSVTLTLKENGGVKLRGRVVNQRGKPVNNAKVQINVMRGQTGGVEVTLKSGADGRFASEMLWPDGTFSLFATAVNHVSAKSALWKGGAGETHDFSALVLQSLDGVLRGVVRDAKGQPIGGARVAVRGGFHETKAPIENLSDAQGRFHLAGLSGGPLIICADKAGQPPGAVWCDGAPTIDVRLGFYAASKSPFVPAAQSQVAAKRVALRYLEAAITQAQKSSDPNKNYTTATLLGYLAKVDAPRAVQLADNKEVRDQLFMELGNAALHRTPPDVATAMAHWNNVKEPIMRTYPLVIGLLQLTKTQPAAAKTLLPQALAMARAVPEVSYRAIMLAKIAGAMNTLQKGSGEALLQETVSAAQKLTSNDFEGYARAEVARELVAQDFDSAWKLIEPTKDQSEKARYIGMLAYRLAPTDPDRAIKLVRENLDESNQGYKLPALCAAIALNDLPKAEALAATLKDNAKMRAFGWMAEAIAPYSRTTSFSRTTLLEVWRKAIKAGEAARTKSEFTYLNIDTELMFIVSQGRKWSAPDVDSLARLLFVTRPKREENAWDSGAQNIRDEANYARTLLLASPALGRDYARSLLAAWRSMKINNDSDESTRPFGLALEVDPLLAEEIMSRANPAQKTSYVSQAANYAFSTPQKRLENLRGTLGFAEPDEDD